MFANLSKELRIFVDGAFLSYVALFRWLRPSTYVASKLIMPLSQLLFFTFLGIYATGRESASYYLIGNAVQLAAINGIYGVTMTIGNVAAIAVIIIFQPELRNGLARIMAMRPLGDERSCRVST